MYVCVCVGEWGEGGGHADHGPSPKKPAMGKQTSELDHRAIKNKMLSSALEKRENPAFHYFYAVLDGSGVMGGMEKDASRVFQMTDRQGIRVSATRVNFS